jgi:DNA-binding NarL/FixJ family response regulator
MPEGTQRNNYKDRGVIYISRPIQIVEQELKKHIISLFNSMPLQSGGYNKKMILTKRQKEMLHFALKGTPVTNISIKTNINLKTVYYHRRALYSKLGIRNLAGFYKQKHIIEMYLTSGDNLYIQN